jgi:hypothetical protein
MERYKQVPITIDDHEELMKTKATMVKENEGKNLSISKIIRKLTDFWNTHYKKRKEVIK